MDWLFQFPQIDSDWLLSIKRVIDGSLRQLTRVYGQSIEGFFYPLLHVLMFFEKAMINAPWPIVMLGLGAIAGYAARRWSVAARRSLGCAPV